MDAQDDYALGSLTTATLLMISCLFNYEFDYSGAQAIRETPAMTITLR